MRNKIVCRLNMNHNKTVGVQRLKVSNQDKTNARVRLHVYYYTRLSGYK